VTLPESAEVASGATAPDQGDGKSHPGHSVSFSAIASDVGAIYGLQAFTYALPIITLAYLAHVLGPGGLGLVAFGQSVGGYVTVLVEYGFHLTLTREVARNRSNAPKLSQLLAAVWVAKAILSLAAIPLLFGFTLFGKGYDIGLASIVFLWSISQAFNLQWYLHGTEQLRLSYVFDAAGRLLALIGIFLTVKNPSQVKLVFVWQAVGGTMALATSIPVAYKANRFVLPRFSAVRDVLKLGWPMFVQNGCAVLYPSGNIIILGIVTSSAVIGLYSGPDRIIRGAVSLLVPVLVSAYPRISRVAQSSPSRGASLAAVTVWTNITIGAALTLVLAIFAPLIVRLALGPGFVAAVSIMRILALIPLLRSVTMAISFAWMMPFGYERESALVYVFSSAAGLVLAALAAVKWGAQGAAWVTVVIEFSVVVAQLGALSRGQFNPAKALWNRETRQMMASGLHAMYSKLW
jgi:polysaccharide transporter, PST family